MRGEKVEKRPGESVAEEHVADFRGVGVANPRSLLQAADLLQRPGDSARIPRELHRRSVGQKLALTVDGGLDQLSEKDAQVAENHQHQADNEDRNAGSLAFDEPPDE